MTEQELRCLSKMILKELLPVIKQEIAKGLEKETDKVMSADEAAVYLKRSKWWLYNRINEIPHVQKKKGTKVFFMKSSLDDYIRNL